MALKEGGNANAPGTQPEAWNGPVTVSLSDWIEAQLASAPEIGVRQRRTLAHLLELDPQS